MTFSRIAADFYQGVHEQMHCKPDLVAREVTEEVVDRLPSFIVSKLSPVPYAILGKKGRDSIGIILARDRIEDRFHARFQDIGNDYPGAPVLTVRLDFQPREHGLRTLGQTEAKISK